MNKTITPRISLLDPGFKYTRRHLQETHGVLARWQGGFFSFDGNTIPVTADSYQQEQLDEHASMAIRERK